jgi:hypothetical protein
LILLHGIGFGVPATRADLFRRSGHAITCAPITRRSNS